MKITTETARKIIEERARKVLLEIEKAAAITPHSFRHYFVTQVLGATGNIKVAQELARHSQIVVTQRYAHLSNDELDRGYYETFEEGETD